MLTFCMLLAAAVTVPSGCRTAGAQRAYMALDGNGARKRSVFYTDTQAIWCDLDYSSGRKDITVESTIRAVRVWSEALGAYVGVDAVLAAGEAQGQQGTGNTAGFQWELVDATGTPAQGGTVPYPVGDFVCDMFLDGERVASLPFTVDFPACPVAPVIAAVPCAGWVRAGSVCPDAVGRPCACTAGVWTC